MIEGIEIAMPIMSFYCSRGIEAQANTSTIENPALK
jgi:hypothetical protein